MNSWIYKDNLLEITKNKFWREFMSARICQQYLDLCQQYLRLLYIESTGYPKGEILKVKRFPLIVLNVLAILTIVCNIHITLTTSYFITNLDTPNNSNIYEWNIIGFAFIINIP